MNRTAENLPATHPRRAFGAYVAGRRQARHLDVPCVPPDYDGGQAAHFRRGFWRGKEAGVEQMVLRGVLRG